MSLHSVGQQYDEAEKYIAPTLLLDVSLDDAIMQEEIFGPILPLVCVSSAQEAVDLINDREKALTMYVFTEDKRIHEKFLAETSSGSVLVNDTIMHLTVDGLPFGGVGSSGMGAYHGKVKSP